jgi:purine-cytosine permease-like protein
MKRLFLLSFILSSSLQAQETGAAAANASESTSEWVNWVFAGSAIVTATIGVVAVSVDYGRTTH